MKRTLTLLFSFCLLFSSYLPVEAKNPDTSTATSTATSTYTEYINDDLYAEVELCVTSKNDNTFSTYGYLRTTASVYASTKQRTASKTYNIKNSSGTTLGSYTLTGTFQYNGSSSACTKASYATSVSSSNCYFSSKSSSKSGNTATGSFTFVDNLSGIRITQTLTLKCSANGTIQ